MSLPKDKRAKALHALKEAEEYISGGAEVISDEAMALVDMLKREGEAIKQAGTALVLALIKDEYTPAELFKPWASVKRIRQWRDDPAIRLDVQVMHGRCCVKPSAFFKHWNTLKN